MAPRQEFASATTKPSAVELTTKRTVAQSSRRSGVIPERWRSRRRGALTSIRHLSGFAQQAQLATMESTCILSIVENGGDHPNALEASAALNAAEASRAKLAQRVATPSWFFTSIGAAIAAQIASLAVGVGATSPETLAALVAGIVALAAVAGVQLARFRRLNGVWLGGFLSRVVLGTGGLASASYAVASVAAILAAFGAHWWLVAIWSAIGGAAYALSGRRWLSVYRAEPASHAQAESAVWIAVMTVAALAGLALLLIYR